MSIATLQTSVPGLRATSLKTASGAELTLSLAFEAARPLAAQWRAVEELLAAQGATVVAQELFGAPTLALGLPATARWPITWAGEAQTPVELSGTLVTAVTGAKVERLELDGRVIGSAWDDGRARWCRLGGLWPAQLEDTPAEQARATFALMEAALGRAGLGFGDVVRTWFYNRDILGWYGDFNAARSAFFRARGVFDGLVPASTGIGLPNPAGAALVSGLLAVRATDGSVKAAALPSPLQCPAPRYGSSFSRAVELATVATRRLIVSGTASIEPGGQSAHPGDLGSQVELTLQVVHAILKSRGAGWGDVTRGVAYLRRAEDLQPWRRLLEARGLSGLPLVTTHGVVCREDLLFELELDAAISAPA